MPPDAMYAGITTSHAHCNSGVQTPGYKRSAAPPRGTTVQLRGGGMPTCSPPVLPGRVTPLREGGE